MELGLKGRTALITGASKGIGAGVARALAEEGVHLHLAARTAPLLQALADQLKRAHGVSVEIHAADISDGKVPAMLLERIGTPDILVNNAGAIPAGDIAAVDEERWRTAWDLKVFGYINMARVFYQAMRQRGRGVIVNVTGLAADKPDYGYIAGTTGNAGLNAFTRALGGYSTEHGVRVVAVSPGPVETERLVTLMKARAKAETGNEDRWQQYLAGLPMQRPASVAEVADVVTFMASDRASYVSGVVLTVDGGHGSRGGSFAR